MSRVLILYRAADDGIEAMADAVADGAREAGAEVELRLVPEPSPENDPRGVGAPARVAASDELADYDAIAVGVGGRDGRMADFLDEAGGPQAGVLAGKVGSAFTADAASRRDKPIMTAIHVRLLRLGMVVVGPGASESEGPRDQGRRIAGIAERLFPRTILESGETAQTEHFMLSR